MYGSRHVVPAAETETQKPERASAVGKIALNLDY